MLATHFGAGNIGRGFIGQVLFNNDFEINFVDVNETIIDELNSRGEYTIQYADESHEEHTITNVHGINNAINPQEVIKSISQSDIVTTAIGPNILPIIAELIADGIKARMKQDNINYLDVIACENMIGGSEFLQEKVNEFLSNEELAYAEQYIGFPNAAVDRIVPLQNNEDPLFVSVEPFKEWVVDESKMKNPSIKLDGVKYVGDLEPFIERKLLSVNTGHATVAYWGFYKGYENIIDAINDSEVLGHLKDVLSETSTFLEKKWHFSSEEHEKYVEKVIERFKNKYISDDITRVARNPIRKLGYNERFIKPIRELEDMNESNKSLIDTVSVVLHYDNPNDAESAELMRKLKTDGVAKVVKEITEINNEDIVNAIQKKYDELR